MLSPSPPASVLADSALEFLIQFPAKVHVFGEHKGNPKHLCLSFGDGHSVTPRDTLKKARISAGLSHKRDTRDKAKCHACFSPKCHASLV